MWWPKYLNVSVALVRGIDAWVLPSWLVCTVRGGRGWGDGSFTAVCRHLAALRRRRGRQADERRRPRPQTTTTSTTANFDRGEDDDDDDDDDDEDRRRATENKAKNKRIRKYV
jgi:hypothetical protein